MAVPRTVSDEFNDKNYQKNNATWGEVGRRDSTRKIVTKERQTVGVVNKNPNQRFAANDPRHQTIDEAFNDESGKRGIQPTALGAGGRKQQEQELSVALQESTTRRSTMRQTPAKLAMAKSSATEKALELRARIKATRLNMVIGSVGWFVWLTFQLPLAILSLVAFGTAIAVADLDSAITEINGDDGVIKKVGKSIAGVVLQVGRTITDSVTDIIRSLTNIDLSVFLPSNVFMLTYMVIVAFAIVQFFIIFLLYKTSLINPFGGKGSGQKMGTFLLMMVGYCVPLLNLFPWFLVWIVAVWINPK